MNIDIPNYCKRVHFNIYDFIDWDQAKYPNDPCFVSRQDVEGGLLKLRIYEGCHINH